MDNFPINNSDNCPICTGHGWVCETHPNQPWHGLMPEGSVRCCDGAGAPCVRCNPCDANSPPKKTGMADVYFNENGANQ